MSCANLPTRETKGGGREGERERERGKEVITDPPPLSLPRGDALHVC